MTEYDDVTLRPVLMLTSERLQTSTCARIVPPRRMVKAFDGTIPDNSCYGTDSLIFIFHKSHAFVPCV